MQRFVRSSACLVNNAVKFSIQRNNLQITKRYISESSWAADKLQEAGEVLTPRVGDDIIVDENMINQPTDKVKALAEQFLELNAIEASQLLKVIQTRLAVSDAMLEGFFGGGGGVRVVAAADAGGAEAAPAEEAKPKEAWDLKLCSYEASSKIKIIKEIRVITGLGLKEAKEMAEKPLPIVLKTGVKKDDAESFQEKVKAVGGVLELV